MSEDKNLDKIKNEDIENTELVDSFLNEDGGKQKLEMLLRREEYSAELLPFDPIYDKINSEHITQYLNGAEKNMERDFEDRNNQRKFTIIVLIIGVFSILGVIFILKEKEELLKYVVTSVGSLIAGAIGGYGLGKNKFK